MSLAFGRSLAVGLIALAGSQFAASSSFAADPVVWSQARSSGHIYREARSVRTTYIYSRAQECDDLRVTDPDSSRIVTVCYVPKFF